MRKTDAIHVLDREYNIMFPVSVYFNDYQNEMTLESCSNRHILQRCGGEFKDTKVVIRIRTSKKNIKHNG